jgi:NADH-quinone oxidoreductase subunit L
MLVLVTGIGALIHIYSLGYMKDDGQVPLLRVPFLFHVLDARNRPFEQFRHDVYFLGTRGVSSYLLIGHWFERDAAADAAKKAFITNRVGDFGFMLGILMAWTATGTVVFHEMAQQLGRITSYPGYLTVAVLLVFCGAVGKSAQFPLHVWLPDAMEGPTPISALIQPQPWWPRAPTCWCASAFLSSRTGGARSSRGSEPSLP